MIWYQILRIWGEGNLFDELSNGLYIQILSITLKKYDSNYRIVEHCCRSIRWKITRLCANWLLTRLFNLINANYYPIITVTCRFLIRSLGIQSIGFVNQLVPLVSVSICHFIFFAKFANESILWNAQFRIWKVPQSARISGSNFSYPKIKDRIWKRGLRRECVSHFSDEGHLLPTQALVFPLPGLDSGWRVWRDRDCQTGTARHARGISKRVFCVGGANCFNHNFFCLFIIMHKNIFVFKYYITNTRRLFSQNIYIYSKVN